MLLHLPAVLTRAQLDSLLSALRRDDAPWTDGRVTAGHQSARVKHNEQLEEASPMAREFGALVLAALERNPLFVSAALPNRVSTPLFNRYRPGMQFGEHVDSAIRMLPLGQKLRTDLSATVFLSPTDSYQGGELVVEDDFGSQSIKLDAGDMILYRSAARHRVAPLVAGERIAAVFWVQSLVTGHAERNELFELDRTIQRLTELNADQDSLLRLTAHYHSLLRLWSTP